MQVECETDQRQAMAARLYDECAAEMVLYGRALGLSHAESEDVLHDSFRALLGSPEIPREPRFYLVRTFRNRALNHRRSLLRRWSRESEAGSWFEGQAPGESALESDLSPEAAEAALEGLPREQREVIVLKLWHGLTFEAIGELLEISPNTAAGRYRYGLQKLRFTFKRPDHEPVRRSGGDPAWLPAAHTVGEG